MKEKFESEREIFRGFIRKHRLLNIGVGLIFLWICAYYFILIKIEEPIFLTFFSELGEIASNLSLAILSGWIFYYTVDFREQERRWLRVKNDVLFYAWNIVEKTTYLLEIYYQLTKREIQFPADFKEFYKLREHVNYIHSIPINLTRIEPGIRYNYEVENGQVSFEAFIENWIHAIEEDLENLNVLYFDNLTIRVESIEIKQRLKKIDRDFSRRLNKSFFYTGLVPIFTSSSRLYTYLLDVSDLDESWINFRRIINERFDYTRDRSWDY